MFWILVNFLYRYSSNLWTDSADAEWKEKKKMKIYEINYFINAIYGVIMRIEPLHIGLLITFRLLISVEEFEDIFQQLELGKFFIIRFV